MPFNIFKQCVEVDVSNKKYGDLLEISKNIKNFDNYHVFKYDEKLYSKILIELKNFNLNKLDLDKYTIKDE
jgi:hypothetical protein